MARKLWPSEGKHLWLLTKMRATDSVERDTNLLAQLQIIPRILYISYVGIREEAPQQPIPCPLHGLLI